ncbi:MULTISPECIES: cytochrome c [unclassified Paenibacillus]|uniref:c-type cytochrome n=1 Tax=unclassified Paenibacillus TaxID=185978 RepID=UPI001AE783AC|nr:MULTISPECIES: cytochrome c [unclassified Paenibacillus]MBP1155918.1 mono/diheme cytochrome c family protein [Paenibacillus sp. PvP091]MBP1168696.1 mono/diheme cytochrome c family protein [Paenibacillus sp. PvR098]MBP2439724.1 mono/diheme cytochrome c family protein [Paenibacillus sp. PvP052]
MERKWGIIAIGLAIAVGLTACGGGSSDEAAKPPQAADGGGTVNAEAIYRSNCVTCHGADLTGGSGPNLQKVGARLSKDQIVAKIENGGAGMPAYKNTLEDNEIAALAEWLSTKK